ncbi:SET domain-containing protein [Tetraselmis virus 1]|uniref:SET domain-containing protein n=1 Tax=Tetraselmis virus 1 TaxID=2060617 RepID=A0A2P0VN11_9VIRU|nr:SET domain-containing protein [Tetraselmis virus 1]AUF82273.1 SET domain-containing protein [Tetraselmis virus 1]
MKHKNKQINNAAKDQQIIAYKQIQNRLERLCMMTDTEKMKDFLNKRLNDKDNEDKILGIPSKHNCYVKKSNIANAGQGLFASKLLQQNSIVTFYPVHYILSIKDYNKDYKTEDVEIFTRPDYPLDDGPEFQKKIQPYAVQALPGLIYTANPDIPVNSTEMGHVMNDAGEVHANCQVLIVSGHPCMVTKRNIKQDEELYWSYGSKYWEFDKTAFTQN